jgi:DNA-3-methyladenine glycosylase II
MDSLAGGEYRRLLDLGSKLALASVRSIGSIEAPELAVEIQGDGLTADEAASAERQVAWLLGASQDLGPFYTLAGEDPTMSAIVRRFYGLHLPHTASVFEALVLAILGQQIATNVARIIRTLLIETYGPRQAFDGEVYYAFPRPERLGSAPIEELRGLKLSQRKAEYVQGIARSALSFSPAGLESLHQVSDDVAVQRVQELRGVGPWTAQWVLVRGLGRPDALPLGDLALRRAVSRLYFSGDDVTDVQVEELARRWSPWRTFATVYLFTALRGGMA